MSSSECLQNADFVHILPDHQTELRDQLCRQWQEKQFCDVTISLREGEVRAHSCVLAAFSPRLKAILDSLNSPNKPEAVNDHFIPLTFQESVFRCLLSMMYTGILSFSAAMLSSVLSTARWLQMEDVVKLCQEYREAVVGDGRHEFSAVEDSVLTEVNLEEVKEEEDFFHQMRRNGGGTKHESKQRRQRKSKRRGASKVASSSKCAKDDAPTQVTIKVEPEIEIEDVIPEIIQLSDVVVDTVTEDTTKEASLPEQGCQRTNKRRRQQKKRDEPTKAKHRPVKSQKTKAKTPCEPKVKIEIPSLELVAENGDCSLTGDTLMTSEQWVEAQDLTGYDKEEAEFTSGKTCHIRCKKCLVKFTDLDKYLCHIADHPSFQCDHCHITYYRSSNLTRHLRTSHSTEYHLKCKKCEFAARTERALRNHFREVHGGDKPFICDHPGCMYSSWKLEFLNRHAQIHSTVKRYICNKCGQGYSQYPGLVSHERTCYQLQQFLCDVCGQAFNHIQSMRAHRRTIHFGEKPYLCKVCGNQFSDQRNLKRHMRIHDNSFPYQCPMCQQNYRHSNSLKAHLKKHEKEGLSIDVNAIMQNEVGKAKRKRREAIRSEQTTGIPGEQSDNCNNVAVGSEFEKDFLTGTEPSVSNGTGTVFPGQVITSNVSQLSDKVSTNTADSLGQVAPPRIGGKDGDVGSVETVMEENVFTSVSLCDTDDNVELEEASDGVGVHQTSGSCALSGSGDNSVLVTSSFHCSVSRLEPSVTTANAGAAITRVEFPSESNSEKVPALYSTGAQSPGTLDDFGKAGGKVAVSRELDSNATSKGQPSYGLQTLAEICFSSSL